MDVLCLVREMVRVMTQPASVGASECMWSHHYYHQRHPVFSLFPGWGAPCSEIMCSPRGSLQPPSPSAERPQSTPPHGLMFILTYSQAWFFPLNHLVFPSPCVLSQVPQLIHLHSDSVTSPHDEISFFFFLNSFQTSEAPVPFPKQSDECKNLCFWDHFPRSCSEQGVYVPC